jgi:hypothetical protein
MHGTETTLDLRLIIVRWLTLLFRGGMKSVRGEYCLAPVRADFGPRRGQFRPARFPSVGWMTMRLDLVPRAGELFDRARVRGRWAACLRWLPRRGA